MKTQAKVAPPSEVEAIRSNKTRWKKWAIIIVASMRIIAWCIIISFAFSKSSQYYHLNFHVYCIISISVCVPYEMVGLIGAVRMNVCAIRFYLVFNIIWLGLDLLAIVVNNLMFAEKLPFKPSGVFYLLIGTFLYSILVKSYLNDCRIARMSKLGANVAYRKREEECKIDCAFA